MLVHWAFILFWWVSQSLPLKNSPTAWGCYQHTLLLGWYSAGNGQRLFPSSMMLSIEVQQRILFLRVWGSWGAFFVNSKCVFFCFHWGEDWVWPHRHKAQIGGVLQWCFSFYRNLLSPHMIMELNYSDHHVLGHHSNQSPSPSVAQFGQEANSKKNPGCFKLLPLRVTETTCFCDLSMKQIFFLNSSPDV